MMTIKGVIFDLDQTIVDSSIAEAERKARNWKTVCALIPKFQLYHGFNLVFGKIRELGLHCCIVTNSPKAYAKKVVHHFKIPCQIIVDFFAVSKRKPFPDPMYKAMELLNLNPHELITFGDMAIDIHSSNSAGIASVACIWGSNEKDQLINANPSQIIYQPTEILDIIEHGFLK